MKFFVSVLVATISLTSISGARAQSNVRPAAVARTPASIVKSVTEPDLRALVLAEGHTIDEMHPFEAPSVRGKTKEGLLFVVIGTACDKEGVPGCQGVMMQVRYDADSRVTMDAISNANRSEAALSSWWDRDTKTVGFTRYVVLDGGITWMNLRQNLRVLINVQGSGYKYAFPD